MLGPYNLLRFSVQLAKLRRISAQQITGVCPYTTDQQQTERR